MLGTNIFNHLLLLLADVADGSSALFASIEDSAAVAAAVGVVLVGIYIARLAGPAERTHRRAGFESFLIPGVYVAGTVLIFAMGE